MFNALSKRSLRTVFVWSLALSAAAGSVHAEVDALVRQAQELSASGQGEQAYALLEPQEAARAGDPDFDLALGIAANQASQYTRAILALERLLAVEPDNSQGGTELGRALYGVGDYKAARALLAAGKLKGLPAVSGEPIDQLLHAIDRVEQAGRSSIRGYLEAGAGHDSNTNSAPGVTNVAVPFYGGSTLTLSPAGAQRKSPYAMVGGGASGRLVVDPRWSFVGTVSGSTRGYRDANDIDDSLQVDGQAGVSYRVERSEYVLAAQLGVYNIDHRRVRDLYGLVGEWTYRLDGFRQFNAYVQLTRLMYPQQPVSNADRWVLGTTYAHLVSTGLWTYAGVYVGQEAERAAGVGHLGHKLIGLRGGVQYSITNLLSVFMSGGWEERRFGGPDPLFLVDRHDEQVNVSIGLSWIPVEFWRVTPQYSYTSTRSNVPLASYKKRVLSVTARREF